MDEKITLYRDINNGQEGTDPNYQRWFPKTIDEAVVLTDEDEQDVEVTLKERLAQLKKQIAVLEEDAANLSSLTETLKSNLQDTQTSLTNTNNNVTKNTNDIAQINSDFGSTLKIIESGIFAFNGVPAKGTDKTNVVFTGKYTLSPYIIASGTSSGSKLIPTVSYRKNTGFILEVSNPFDQANSGEIRWFAVM